ncbi:unnamed protein product [Echinostoma caproni]|uniref:GRIP domain-containing protein n=1 Tax=Echinostoma caproni TaxID=27848 RepID=A0A183A8C1_9TREM|nr:unnamed protein product [Echinostoma caproni]
METLVLRLSETEGRLHQLRKQYDELNLRYEQAQSTHTLLKQDADHARLETSELRRQLNAQLSLQTHQADTVQKWTNRLEKSERELTDLRRNHDRLLSQSANHEEQISLKRLIFSFTNLNPRTIIKDITHMRDSSEKKQNQIQSLLTTVAQLNVDLSSKERELEEWKERSIGAERKTEQLNTELLEATERFDRLQDALKAAESIQTTMSERIAQLTRQHQESIKRYEDQVERMTSQLDVYKKQVEEVTGRLELSQKQKLNFAHQDAAGTTFNGCQILHSTEKERPDQHGDAIRMFFDQLKCLQPTSSDASSWFKAKVVDLAHQY